MRFYVSPESIFLEKKAIEIKDKGEIHHIRDVMRLNQGMDVNVFDGKGREYSGDIKEINRNLIVIEIKKTIALKADTSYNLTLYQAIPKKSKLDFIVEKAVELGVGTIVPIHTKRTVPSAIKEKLHARKERWVRIANAASKQCGRIKLPVVSNPTNFNSALIESRNSDLVIFAALDKEAKPLREILKGANPKTIAVFIGPEGDFTQDEITMAMKEGYGICSLGSSVYRVETAAIYILSCLNYEYNQ